MRLLFIASIHLFLSCNTREDIKEFSQIDNNYFNNIKQNDVELAPTQKGDWLYDHKEAGQNFDSYKLKNTLKPNDSQNIIYLKPIGEFNSLQQKALQLTTEFVSICFNTQTILLPAITDSTVSKNYKRKREDGNIQLLASHVLDSMLLNKYPKNGIVCMAFTQKDLYPKPEWNFVFGLAYYNRGCAVSSIYRLQNKTLDSSNFSLFLRRLINVSTHEIGHMFGLQHCVHSLCTMNGSNSLRETDKCPNRFCTECQEKLTFNFKYNNHQRLQKMLAFFNKNGLVLDYNLIAKDWQDSFSNQ